jgi:hypothetical protein
VLNGVINATNERASFCFGFMFSRFVMPGLVPGIHVFSDALKTWMAGTSPAMTVNDWPPSAYHLAQAASALASFGGV